MDLNKLPYMLFADKNGNIYDHPYYRMVGITGSSQVIIRSEDLIILPTFSKLFFIPDCPPLGLDPETGEIMPVHEVETEDEMIRCQAVAAFPEL